MLKRITSDRKYRRFIVYDLEWIPGRLTKKFILSNDPRDRTPEVRLVGVYDKHKGYRSYVSIQAFLANEMTSSNRGAWFYAHSGGAHDIQFVFEHILRNADENYIIDGSFASSSLIICHCRRSKNAWHFVDSYWTIRESLAKIGEWVGIGKGRDILNSEGVPFEDWDEQERAEWYANVDFVTLRKYNADDCEILWIALDQFENVLYEFGGQLQMTLASSAMHLFRRKFLRSDISTNTNVNAKARESYFGSRVEVFSRHCLDAFYYDINSSFPFAMQSPCPGDFLGSNGHIPDSPDEKKIYIADVDLEIPESYLPTTPVRLKSRVFFPTGRWRAWLSNIDIELLVAEGGRIHRVYEVLHFAPFYDLVEFSTTIYDRRKAAKTDFEKVVFKLLLNSLYGKFAECETKQALMINPSDKVHARLRLKEQTGESERLKPGIWLESKIVNIPHMHVPIATHITAIARRNLYNHLSSCSSMKFWYCDTDGFATNAHLETGLLLGDLKLEKVIQKGYFKAPKVYRMDEKVKAKGFSLGWSATNKKKQDAAIIKFEKLIEGQEIEIERMARLREIYRRGVIRPTEKIIRKMLRGKLVPKRFTFPDGETRPWTIEELHERVK